MGREKEQQSVTYEVSLNRYTNNIKKLRRIQMTQKKIEIHKKKRKLLESKYERFSLTIFLFRTNVFRKLNPCFHVSKKKHTQGLNIFRLISHCHEYKFTLDDALFERNIHSFSCFFVLRRKVTPLM